MGSGGAWSGGDGRLPSWRVRRYPVLEALEPRLLLDGAAGAEQAVALFGVSPALFVENLGQWADPGVRYVFDGDGANVLFTDAGPVFQVFSGTGVSPVNDWEDSPFAQQLTGETPVPRATQFSVHFDGANAVSPVGLDPADSVFNYFLGETSTWRDNVPTYRTVAYPDLYDGIDLHTWGRRDSLKYEFHVSGGADYREIRMSYAGIVGLAVDGAGALHVQTELGELVDDAPYIYQIIDGREVQIDGAFVLVDADTYAFDVTGPYDPSVELVIDPVLLWSTYAGGDLVDHGAGVAVDSAGDVYVTGSTSSLGWVSGGFGTSHNGGTYDVFVAKLDSAGGHVWSTYLGGGGDDTVYDMVVDAWDNVLVSGETTSSAWVSGGFDTSYNGGAYDAFVAKLDAAGGHVWSTYLGGAASDHGVGIGADSQGNVLVTGVTSSSTTWVSGGFDTSYGGGAYDAFAAKLDPSGAHVWSTYLGGGEFDVGYGIDSDAANDVLIVGETSSSGWVSGGSDTSYNGGGSDAFVAKLDSDGGHAWSTYAGGDGSDTGYDIAVDWSDEIVVTGQTGSAGWVSDGFDTSHNGGTDAFVARYSSAGVVEWSTYLGGSGSDAAYGIVTDAWGNALVTGQTNSSGWVSNGFDTSYNGGVDAFVAKVSTHGEYEWATYLGGADRDTSEGIAVDTDTGVYVAGWTGSDGWTAGGYDTSYNGSDDAFVARIEDVVGMSIDDVSVVEGNSGTTEARFTVTITQTVGQPVRVDYSVANGTASDSDDYGTVGGTLEIPPGFRTGRITVPVYGDTEIEADETFYINLSSPSGPMIADGQGQCTIINDDYIPTKIAGHTWHDADGDGTWDAGEAPLEGWTVFLDDDEDGAPGAGETSTVTAVDGSYEFIDLVPGDYVVAEVLQGGWVQTGPAGGAHHVTPSGAGGVADVDFFDRPGAQAVDDTATVAEESAATAIDVMANDTGIVPSASVTVSDVSDPAGGTALIAPGGGAVTYEPDADFTGQDTFTYTIDDNGVTSTADVTVTVTPLNDAPTAQAQAASTSMDTAHVITLGAGDVETGYANLTFNVPAATDQGGTLTEVAHGQFRYDPPAGYVGDDTFSFTVTDDGDLAGSHANPGDLTSPAAVVAIRVGTVVALAGSETYTDAGGNEVTVKLTGPGGGMMYFPTEADADLVRLELTGTTDKSVLMVTVKGARGATTNVTDITVAGALRMLKAPAVSLLGDLDIDGLVTMVTLGTVAAGHDISIAAGVAPGSITAKDKVKITFDRVADTVLDTHVLPIQTLTVTDWLEADGAGGDDVVDTVVTTWLGGLRVKGRRANVGKGVPAVGGNFEADLVVSGVGATRSALGNVQIAGDLTGADWDVTGAAAAIKVAGTVTNWTLHSTGAGLTGVKSLMLGDVAAATVDVDGELKTAKMTRWQTGRLDAHTVNAFNVLGRRANARTGTPAVPGDCGAAVNLTGGAAGKATLGSTRIAGAVTGLGWDVAGATKSIRAGQVGADMRLGDVTSFKADGPLVREVRNGVAAGLLVVQGAEDISQVTFDSLRSWPKTACDYHTQAPGAPVAADVLAAMTLASLKNHAVASKLGRWTGNMDKSRPGLMASYGPTDDPTYDFVEGNAYVYDNALAILAFLAGDDVGQIDDESIARAAQIADALVLLQDQDPVNAAAAADGQFPALTPAPIRDVYGAGIVAASRTSNRATVRAVGSVWTSSGNQAYVAMALLVASDVAGQLGDAARAADYLKTAKEILLYVGRTREVGDVLGGFRLRDAAHMVGYENARAAEHNVDLAWAFGQMAAVEADAALKAQWEAWRDSAGGFCDGAYGPNARFATLDWIGDGWQYVHAGAASDGALDQDLVAIDAGAWNALARGDFRDAAFDMLEFLSVSTDAAGRTYTGFDPGFRAVIDPAQTSPCDGVGSEVTAYMALVAGELGDTAVLAALGARATLTAPAQVRYDTVIAAADGGATDHDLADFLIGQLGEIQLHAANTDALGLVGAPVGGVGLGTGAYPGGQWTEEHLVNGWALGATCWARFAFQGWNVFAQASVG